MKKLLLLFTILGFTRSLSAQNHIPDWYLQVFKKAGLNKTYSISSYIKPTYLLSDFNGDNVVDMALLVINKKSKKRGILIVHQGFTSYYVIGAGSMFGKKGLMNSTI